MKITNKLILTMLAVTAFNFSMAVFNSANAESMSISKYKALDKNLNSEYKAAKNRCEPLTGSTKELCTAKAEATRDNTLAELQASYKPTIQNRYNANMITARGNYRIATKQCESLKNLEAETCNKLTVKSYLRDTSNARLQRNSEKVGEIKKDKTVRLDGFATGESHFITYEFNIYHVRA